MRIVLPVSVHDSHLLPQWSEVHRHLHCGVNHELHIVCAPSVAEQAQEAKAGLEGEFEAIVIHVMASEPVGGWPLAPNAQFWACASFMAENPGVPFLLVELDCLPLRSSAYDAIAAKYTSAGTPYFGNVAKTPWRNDETGRICPSLEGGNDVMMNGCGVYPGNILTRESSKALMEDFMKGSESIEIPWDMHLRHAMRRDGLAHTELIAQHWNTENYTSDGQALHCEGLSIHEIFLKNPKWEVRKCGGRVHPDAVMIHGCKDESLAGLILNDQIPDAFVSKKAVHAEQSSKAQRGDSFPSAIHQRDAEPSRSVADARLDALENKFDRLAGLLERSLQGQAATPKNGKSTVVPAANIDEVDALIIPGSSVVLNKLAKLAGLKPDKLLKLLNEHPDRFTIKGTASWVSRVKIPEPA